MLSEKFDNYAIVTDGKFVYVNVKSNYMGGEKFFGIYNHKYFSFNPKYPVGCLNSVANEEDFRLATQEEIDTFLSDCKKFGYEYDINTNRFVNYKFGHKDGFMTMKMPHYVPFNSFKNRTVIAQFKYDNFMYWIFADKTYTRIQVDFYDIKDDVEFYDSKYDFEDDWDGRKIISLWTVNQDFRKLNPDQPVTHEREAWWYFITHCINFNFYKCTDINELYKVFDEKNFTELGKNFIECGLLDVDDVMALAIEYFNNCVFSDLVTAISNKIKMQEEIEKKMKEINRFDI